MSEALLGRYELVSLIGEGAMGAVYHARDSKLKRPVAIKVMSASLGNGPEAVARFEREAEALAALQHPNIVTIHDYLNMSGNLCLVMELISGDPLDKVIDQRRPISVPQKLAFMASVCRALDYAHNHGVIHRDLKPSNILMLPDGSPKIVDFGIAKMANDDLTHKLTRTSARIGTIAYMSPEQFNGDPVDHRTDIFSAGIVLYELLSGISPFAGAHTTATMKKIVLDPTPALPDTVAGVPKEVHDILNRVLAKEKDDRYPTAAHLAFALERCTQPVPQIVDLPDNLPTHIARNTAAPAINQAAVSEEVITAEPGALSPQNETSTILWILAACLLGLWLVALMGGVVVGAWVHLLLVCACILIFINLVRRKLQE